MATVTVAAVLAAVVGGVPVPGPARAGVSSGRRADASEQVTVIAAYRLPVPGALRVLRPFEPPPGPYAAGHRGVDLADPGRVVLAAGAGVVAFAGSVAGRGVVVIAHPDGLSTEYEPVAASVVAGQRVAVGAVIGRVRGRHGAFAPDTVLHWGARRNGRYVDPLGLLRPLGPVHLLPWSGAGQARG